MAWPTGQTNSHVGHEGDGAGAPYSVHHVHHHHGHLGGQGLRDDVSTSWPREHLRWIVFFNKCKLVFVFCITSICPGVSMITNSFFLVPTSFSTWSNLVANKFKLVTMPPLGPSWYCFITTEKNRSLIYDTRQVLIDCLMRSIIEQILIHRC